MLISLNTKLRAHLSLSAWPNNKPTFHKSMDQDCKSNTALAAGCPSHLSWEQSRSRPRTAILKKNDVKLLQYLPGSPFSLSLTNVPSVPALLWPSILVAQIHHRTNPREEPICRATAEKHREIRSISVLSDAFLHSSGRNLLGLFLLFHSAFTAHFWKTCLKLPHFLMLSKATKY